MSDLVGNPEDRFSRVEAQIMLTVMWSKIPVASALFFSVILRQTSAFICLIFLLLNT